MNRLHKILSSLPLALMSVMLMSCVVNTDQNTIAGDRMFSNDKRLVGEFDQIQVKGDFEVELVSGDPYQVQVEADANIQNYIYSELDGTRLIISHPENVKFKSLRSIRVKVFYKELKSLEMIGNTKIWSQNQLVFDTLHLSFIGAANADFNMNGHYLSGVFPGAVGMDLKGIVNEVEFNFPGAVKLDATDMEVSRFSISMEGAGKADLFVKKQLDVSIAGAGFVYYKGNPDKVTSNIGGIGAVKNLDE